MICYSRNRDASTYPQSAPFNCRLMPTTSLKRISKFRLPSGILGASITDDGLWLVAACMNGVYVVDVPGESASKIGEHRSYASSAAILPTLKTIVTAGYDGTLQWFRKTDHSFIRQTQVHDFWSWDLAVSPDESMIASVTGQYLAGDYKYAPAPEREPSVRIVAADTGEVLHSLTHVPSVQAVAFSPDSQYVAAGNLMGEVRIWNTTSGKQVRSFVTNGFTSWGIVKSHCYLGGIFALRFTANSQHLLLAGMGPMRDPMAGNGRQRWEKWAWNQDTPHKLDETHKDESGKGLMEALTIHPDNQRFVMGGRLRGGAWNAAVFDLASGNRLATLKTGFRITEAMFTGDGSKLIIAGLKGQPSKKTEGRFPHFGRIEVYDVA